MEGGLSGVVVVRDQVATIEACLRSLAAVCDEIVVVDTGSTDGTDRAIINAGFMLQRMTWKGFAATKNAANQLAQHPFVLSLDGDEVLSSDLRDEIAVLKSRGFSPGCVWSCPRLTLYGGRPVRRGGWYPDRKVRLFPRQLKWQGALVHESLDVGPCRVEPLRADLLHYSYWGFTDHWRRARAYSLLTAEKFFIAGRRPGPLAPGLSALGRFVVMVFLRSGWRDGWLGLQIAAVSGAANWVKYRELRRLVRRERWRRRLRRVALSRTDALGDCLLSLPVCWALRHELGVEVVFVTRSYAAPAIRRSAHVAEVVEWDPNAAPDAQAECLRQARVDAVVHLFPNRAVARAAHRAGIRWRVGTARRWFHWMTCNVWPYVARSRRPVHEAQLNLALLRPLGVAHITRSNLARPEVFGLVSQPAPKNGQAPVLLHPGSGGSARDWPARFFADLAEKLHRAGYRVWLTGTAAEGQRFAPVFAELPREMMQFGAFDLSALVDAITNCRAFVSASTGPLHVAAACGVPNVGLFPNLVEMGPQRWGPLGPQTVVLTPPPGASGDDLSAIHPDEVFRVIVGLL